MVLFDNASNDILQDPRRDTRFKDIPLETSMDAEIDLF
jgi:hypothetical protein